jgi:hypothetical protein
MHGWHGQPDLHVMFNMHWEWQKFALLQRPGTHRWRRLVDTRLMSPDDIVEDAQAVPLNPGDHYNLCLRSIVILISQP